MLETLIEFAIVWVPLSLWVGACIYWLLTAIERRTE